MKEYNNKGFIRELLGDFLRILENLYMSNIVKV